MGEIAGFLKYDRREPTGRPVEIRLRDYREVYEPLPEQEVMRQGARCLDCGVPFCHVACPVDNHIPFWNDLVYHGKWQKALAWLHETNNFPEFTGHVCPALCEGSCVLGINARPVAIRTIELKIVEMGFAAGLIQPQPPARLTGRRVAIVGSGPAGLAAAQQLRRAGHDVTVFEKDDRPGGLLRYGIPDFKLEKHIIDRRLLQLEQEGVVFRTGVHVGVTITAEELRRDYDALLLAGGSQQPRNLEVPGRELAGIHFAMAYLSQQNRRCAGEAIPPEREISAQGRHVVVIGGGDTGSDCVGTALRQGATSVTSFELMPQPPLSRPPGNPWPQWPQTLRVSSSHEEGGERLYGVLTTAFEGGERGHVAAVRAMRVSWERDAAGRMAMQPVEGSEFTLPCDLALLALGFSGPTRAGLLEQLGVELDARGNVVAAPNKMTSQEGVFVAGDMARGQSLVVWAIAEGRAAAAGVDAYLSGR